MNSKILKGLKERYNIHPLIFHRSCENARTEAELFDILDTIPEFPIMWDASERRWKPVSETKGIKYDI